MSSVRAFEVKLKTAKIYYTDNAVQKVLFTLPGSAIILEFFVNVTTAFNDSGTDLLDIGIDGTLEYYAADVDLSSADQVVVTQSHLGNVGTRVVEIVGKYAGQNSNATTGVAEVSVLYADPYQN